MIRLLHISDLHDTLNALSDQSILLTALLKDIPQVISPDSLDMIIFSGDLVQSGDDLVHFIHADERLFQPLEELTKLPRSRIVIVPGNHDIDRDTMTRTRPLRAADQEFRTNVRTLSDINTFIDETLRCPSDNSNYFINLSRYMEYESEAFPHLTRSNPFFATYKVQIRNVSIGFALFNTAWRSRGQGDGQDKGALILGERCIDRAVAELQGEALRIAVHHHPLDYLTDADARSVKPRLNESFHLQLFGHRHESDPSQITSVTGTSCLLQCGSLYESRPHPNGYQIIEFDEETSQLNIICRRYADHPRRAYGPDISISENGHWNASLSIGISSQSAPLASLLVRVSDYIRVKANEHLALSSAVASTPLDIGRHVVEPTIEYLESEEVSSTLNALESEPETTDKNNSDSNNPRTSEWTVDQILENGGNFFVTGRPQSGLTTFGYMCAWKSAARIPTPRIPAVFPFSSLRQTSTIKKILNSFYADFELINEVRRFPNAQPVLIIDDVDITDRPRCEILRGLAHSSPGMQFILIAKSLPFELGRQHFKYFDVPTPTLRIKALRRRQMRQLTHSLLCPTKTPDEANEAYEEMLKRCKSLALPRNPYIVVLLLWAITRMSEGKQINESVLIERVVDELMGKANFDEVIRGTFDFRSRSLVCQHLAILLHKAPDLEYIDAIASVGNYLKERRLPFAADAILSSLVGSGILERYDDRIRFRYSRLKSFFFAQQMFEDVGFLNEIIAQKNFLDYAQEIDLYTAMSRKASGIVHAIDEYVTAYDPSFDGLEDGMKELARLPPTLLSSRRLRELKRGGLSAAEVDALLDETDRQVAERQMKSRKATLKKRDSVSNGVLISPRQYAGLLDLLSRAIRNVEYVKADEKLAILRKIYRRWCFIVEKCLEEWHDIAAQFIDQIELGAGREEFEKHMKALGHELVPQVICSIGTRPLATPMLVDLFFDIAMDNDALWYERYLAICSILETDLSEGLNRAGRFLEAIRANKPLGAAFLIHLIVAKLHMLQQSAPIPASLHEDFSKLVAELQIALGENKRSKGRLIASVRSDLSRGLLKN